MTTSDQNNHHEIPNIIEVELCGEAEKNLTAATGATRIRDVVNPLSAAKAHSVYQLKNFRPVMIDECFLRELGVQDIDPEAALKLREGSERFQRLYTNGALTPSPEFTHTEVSLDDPLEIHNYTGLCPTFVQEVTPSAGACSIGCQYCLVTDGDHQARTTILDNYPELVARVLEVKKHESSFYYFSPKTEAFSEPHLQTGIAHAVLRSFVDHFEKHPDSKARLFVATKAGPQHLHFEYKGESILELLSQLKGKAQINGSIGIMPPHLRDILEPNAPCIEERLDALQLCQQAGLFAESILAQPLIIPYLSDDVLEDYFAKLKAAGIKNIKPEFLTVDMGNLVALAQFVNHFDPHLLKPLFEDYVGTDNQNHRKQRSRLAPNRATSAKHFLRIASCAQRHGITLSLCNWVRREVGECDPRITALDQESRQGGYQCLGYQTNILK
jgi:DNA repair photolyase